MRWGRLLCLVLVLVVVNGACRKKQSHAGDAPHRTGPHSTPLHTAAQQSNVEMVRSLLAQGADVNARDGHGETPLHHAAAQASAEVVR